MLGNSRMMSHWLRRPISNFGFSNGIGSPPPQGTNSPSMVICSNVGIDGKPASDARLYRAVAPVAGLGPEGYVTCTDVLTNDRNLLYPRVSAMSNLCIQGKLASIGGFPTGPSVELRGTCRGSREPTPVVRIAR